MPLRGFFVAVFTPAARRLGGVNPNTLSVISLLAGLAAGAAFVLARLSPGWHAAAAALVALSGAADSLDGLVARMHGRVSAWGGFLDHFGDRLVEAAVLGGIAFSPGADRVLGLLVVVATLLHSLAAVTMEARFGSWDYGRIGKAEQFVFLILYALVRTAFPGLSITLLAHSVSFPNAFLAILGIVTVAAILHRLVLAHRAAEGAESRATRPDA